MMENQQKSEEDSEKLRLRDFEAKQNLVGFFSLLLEVDRRNNPERYKNNKPVLNQNKQYSEKLCLQKKP